MNVSLSHRFVRFLRMNTTNILVTLTAIISAFIVIMLISTVQRQADQLNRLNHVINETQKIAKSIQSNSETRTKQYNDLTKHMDCIVQFFSQPDRTQKAIADIDTCRVTETSGYTAPHTPLVQSNTKSTAPETPTTQPAITSKQQPTEASPTKPNGSSSGVLNGTKNLINNVLDIVKGIL